MVRDHDAADRRVRPLRATEAGAAIITGLVELGAWHEQRVLSRLATDDLAALGRGLGAVRRVVEELEGIEEAEGLQAHEGLGRGGAHEGAAGTPRS